MNKNKVAAQEQGPLFKGPGAVCRAWQIDVITIITIFVFFPREWSRRAAKSNLFEPVSQRGGEKSLWSDSGCGGGGVRGSL